MIDEIKNIFNKQREFQKMVGVQIDTNVEHERNKIGENYLFKLIEEVVELRKEFPSVINELSKEQKAADSIRIKEELSDVILFLINFILVWKLSILDIIETIKKVQYNNFKHVKKTKLQNLNTEILSLPGYTVGIGQGNVYPEYILIGMNPSTEINHGYPVWAKENDGSSKKLLPILDELGIRDKCYFTNLVKCTTVDNSEPTMDDIDFWSKYLEKEIEILKYNNPDCKIIAMGKWVDLNLSIPHLKISHPAFVLRGGLTYEQYKNEIQDTLEIE